MVRALPCAAAGNLSEVNEAVLDVGEISLDEIVRPELVVASEHVIVRHLQSFVDLQLQKLNL